MTDLDLRRLSLLGGHGDLHPRRAVHGAVECFLGLLQARRCVYEHRMRCSLHTCVWINTSASEGSRDKEREKDTERGRERGVQRTWFEIADTRGCLCVPCLCSRKLVGGVSGVRAKMRCNEKLFGRRDPAMISRHLCRCFTLLAVLLHSWCGSDKRGCYSSWREKGWLARQMDECFSPAM